MYDRNPGPEVVTRGHEKAPETHRAARRIRLWEGSLVVALLCAMTAGPALAQGSSRDKKPQAASPAAATVVVRHGFGERDREIITTYYTQRASDLPPGLAKREGELPPGLEKQLRRNGTLPPGLQKKLRPFPEALERQLAPLPRGYRRGIVGPHIVVYRTATNVIVDVILNALNIAR